MIEISNHPTRRWRELICVLFGHQWDTRGSETQDGRVREEYNVCSCCFLSKRLVWIEVPSEVGRAWKAIAT
jgi:hypothetical protein